MENTSTIPAAAMPMRVAHAAKAEVPVKHKDHWSVEVTGGMTLVTTMVSALSVWYLFLTFVAFPGVA